MKEHWTDKLRALQACPEAVEWAYQFETFEEAWLVCTRGDWMLWISARTECNVRVLTRAKAECADLVKHLITDQSSLNALQAAFDFADGKITDSELATAANDVTAVSDANDAARAAALAIKAAAYTAEELSILADIAAEAHAAWAARAATYTAYATFAENAIEVKVTLRKCADICRRVLPVPTL